MSDDRRKAAAQHPGRTISARHGGRDKGKGRGCAPWGDIGGEEKEGKNRSGRQEGTTRRKGSAWRSGMGAAPRARVYI